MTETYFRALCAELLAALKVQLDDLRFSSELCRRAEAALAQPEQKKAAEIASARNQLAKLEATQPIFNDSPRGAH